MKVGTIALTAVKKDGVIYIECQPVGDPAEIRRWHAYSAKHSAGKDAHGKYYDSLAHATRVMRAFKQAELARQQQAAREL